MTPLINAPLAIQIHVAAAALALATTAIVALLRKGSQTHVVIGRIWVAAMVVVGVGSFWITGADGRFSWIHGLSVLSLASIASGMVARRRGQIMRHKWSMIGASLGLVGAGAATLLPGRIMHAVAFGG